MPFLLISLQLREVRDSVKKCPDEVIGQLTQVFTTDQPEHIHNVDQVILSIKSLYQRDFDDKVKIPKINIISNQELHMYIHVYVHIKLFS